MSLCCNCKYSVRVPNSDYLYCTNQQVIKSSQAALSSASGLAICRYDRFDSECGMEGKLWEPLQLGEIDHKQEELQIAFAEYLPAKRKRAVQKFVLPEWLEQHRDVWQAWIDARTKAGHPPTDWALQLAVTKLETLKEQGQNPRALLAESAFRGWQSFYPSKQDS